MKIEVGTYKTRDGRTATVTLLDEHAFGTIEGLEYFWYLPDGNYYHVGESGLDLVTRIHFPSDGSGSMKTKIETGVWETIGNFRAHVTKVAEGLSWGFFPGIEEGRQVCWNSQTLKAHDPARPEWDLAQRISDLPDICAGQPLEPSDTTAKPSTLEVRPTQWTVTPIGKPIFDERAMTLKIEDEAGGEFLILENCGDGDGFRFDVEDWPTLRALIDEAVKGVRK